SEDRITAEILRLSDRVASRLTASKLAGRTITLKVRLSDFATHTRSRTLRTPTSDVWTIHRAATDAYRSFRRGRQRVRLLGVSVSGLRSGPVPEQLTLHPRPRYAQAEEAIVKVRDRFGRDAVSLARLIDKDRRDG
ncbi:MAG TPA: DNA polymerase IV, partial [Actinomycetota bacterium]|nr:DNA polymerase IV [Actinomycetota bacterium]